MAFREKSAWAMMVVLGGVGLWYFVQLAGAWPRLGDDLPVGLAAAWLVLVVIGSIVAQVGLALTDTKGADRPADERERPIIQKAGNWSGLMLGTGIVLSLMLYLWRGDGDLLFHAAMGSLIVSSIAQYGFEIALLRRGV